MTLAVCIFLSVGWVSEQTGPDHIAMLVKDQQIKRLKKANRERGLETNVDSPLGC